MPFVRVSTSSQPPLPTATTDLLLKVSQAVAHHLGKPETYVMTCFAPAGSMTFGGSPEPCCFVDVRGIGTPTPAQTSALNTALCGLMESELGVPTARTFVVFTDVPRSAWGAGGRMLG